MIRGALVENLYSWGSGYSKAIRGGHYEFFTALFRSYLLYNGLPVGKGLTAWETGFQEGDHDRKHQGCRPAALDMPGANGKLCSAWRVLAMLGPGCPACSETQTLQRALGL